MLSVQPGMQGKFCTPLSKRGGIKYESEDYGDQADS
jgi:hypothetical protein